MNYTYLCIDCDKKFSFTINWNDTRVIKEPIECFTNVQCPYCMGCNTRKVFHVPNIIYKGKGWTTNENNKEPVE